MYLCGLLRFCRVRPDRRRRRHPPDRGIAVRAGQTADPLTGQAESPSVSVDCPRGTPAGPSLPVRTFISAWRARCAEHNLCPLMIIRLSPRSTKERVGAAEPRRRTGRGSHFLVVDRKTCDSVPPARKCPDQNRRSDADAPPQAPLVIRRAPQTARPSLRPCRAELAGRAAVSTGLVRNAGTERPASPAYPRSSSKPARRPAAMPLTAGKPRGRPWRGRGQQIVLLIIVNNADSAISGAQFTGFGTSLKAVAR